MTTQLREDGFSACPLPREVRADAKARAAVEQHLAPSGVRSREVDRALRAGGQPGVALLDRLCPALRVVLPAPGTRVASTKWNAGQGSIPRRFSLLGPCYPIVTVLTRAQHRIIPSAVTKDS